MFPNSNFVTKAISANADQDVIVQLNRSNFCKGVLPDKKSVIILFDSGASKSLVSQSVINSSSYLSSLSVHTLENSLNFRMGNGQILTCFSFMMVKIFIQGSCFNVKVHIAPHLVGIDLIFGQDTLSELKGSLQFDTNQFHCKSKKVSFTPTHSVYIRPGHTRYVTLYGNVPSIYRNREVLLKKVSKAPSSSFILATLQRNKTIVPISNPGKKTLHLRPSQHLFYFNTDNLFLCDSSDFVHNSQQISHLSQSTLSPHQPELEILKQTINLSDGCILSPTQREEFLHLLTKHKDAFSLYGEIGHCPNLEVDIEVTDSRPFYIRPYHTNESDKQVIDAELEKLVKQGIIAEGHQSYTSPILVLPKKGSTEKRVVVDFRHLNNRIKRYNHPFPLLASTLQRIGNASPKVLSCLDLKSAFFSLPLAPNAQQYTGISSYHGGRHFYFKRLTQGLSVSPAIFQTKMDKILSKVPDSRHYCIAHHDDIIIFSKDAQDHSKHLQAVFKALIDNGLKISPGKCAFFRREVVYMGHIIKVNDDGLVILKALADRCQSIQHLIRPKSSKEVRRFIGAVNYYVSNFLPRLQEVMQPLHSISSKKSKFAWSNVHEEAFQKVKSLLTTPPVLYLPTATGHLTLYSDTSRSATGSYLTQVINGKERILGYYSKKLPPACANYSVTELEMFGLLINITHFQYLLQGVEFTAVVDHSAIVHILSSKKEPCTQRLKRIIIKLSQYSFQTCYKKGTEMVLADFLSRSSTDTYDCEIDQVVPTAFAFSDFAFPILSQVNRPVTRRYAKEQQIPIPDLFPKSKASSTVCIPSSVSQEDIPPTTPTSDFNPDSESFDNQSQAQIPHKNVSNQVINPATPSKPPSSTKVPTYQNTTYLGKHRPVVSTTETCPEERLVDKPEDGIDDSIPIDLCIPPKPLLHNCEKVVSSHFPKQAELTKLYNVIKRKIIRDYNLPFDQNKLRLEQETSPYFKQVYNYLAHDILPSNRKAAKRLKLQSEEYILAEQLLFRLLVHDDDRFTLQLAVPESMCNGLIHQYHDSQLCNHQGVVRTYLTLRKLFYFPNMFQRITQYVNTCSTCQQFKPKTDTARVFHPRIPEEYNVFSKLSIDFKSMPTSVSGFKHLLVVCDEITRFVICVPTKSVDAETVCEALIQKVVCLFGPPSVIISDAASSFTGKLVSSLCTALGISQKVISVANHGSLLVERQIRSISDFLKVNLNQYGTDWVRYVSTCCYAYNSFSSSRLGSFCPYELVFGRKPKNLTHLNWQFDGICRSYSDYISQLKDRFDHMSKTIMDLQKRQQESQNISVAHNLSKNPVRTQCFESTCAHFILVPQHTSAYQW
ncbi:hypothetical protein SNE40_011194 [Patella caerulea]|uniref:Endonuclease n=1 Tax=Patella caerulea TaxID=87958 RepID=A0AAN8JJH8_PATCE